MPKYISTKEAARRLGISGRQVRHLIKSGQLHADLIGGGYVIDADEIEKLPPRQVGYPKGKPRKE
jgi:excisionase family DNA binding protein